MATTTSSSTDASSIPPSTCRLALCQILVGNDKAINLEIAKKTIAEAAKNNAQIIALPECFNSPYATDQFPIYAEPIPSSKADIDPSLHPSVAMLSSVAAEHKIYLIGGSIPERDPTDNKVYNTCVVFGPDGAILTKHRKMHLFDINVPGRITFKESDTLSAGNALATFDTPYGKVGLGICYDLRFPYLAMLLRDEGCKILVYPGAFNMTTGPAHWELLQRARALDTQSYVAAVSIARNPASAYQAWGHSTVINPWGEVIATTDENPTIVYADLQLKRIEEIRQQIPVSFQKRNDLYSLQWNGSKGNQ